MTAVGSGIASQIVYVPESTYGVAPSLSTVESLEIKSETLELKKTAVQGQGLHAGGRYDRNARRVLTNYAVTGGLVLDLPTRFIGNLVQAMIGSYGYTLATPTQIASTTIYKSVHWPKTPFLQGHSLCFQKGVPTVDGTVEPFTYVGCKISDWEMSVATGALAQLTLTIDGRNELAGAFPNGGASASGDPLNTSTPALATFNSIPSSGLDLSSFHFREATIFSGGTPTVVSNAVENLTTTGGSAVGNVRSASVKHSVSLDNARYFLGNSGFKAEQIENGFASITGQFVVEWLSSEAMYAAFASDTTTSLQITLTGATVSTSNYLFDIIIPNIKLEGEAPKVSGPQVVTQSVNWTGLDDESTTPIQITLQNQDTTL